MKKRWIVLVGLVAIIAIWFVMKYNRFATAQENLKQTWGQVENVYQRRADLIPNLVAVVKSYADFEQETLIAVTEARAKASQVNVNDLNDISAYASSQDALDMSLERLLIIAENYPDLKANEQYLTLQAQLAGCENRILTERQRYNEAVKSYNQSIRRFPANIVAKLFGFEEYPYFEASSEDAEQAPRI